MPQFYVVTHQPRTISLEVPLADLEQKFGATVIRLPKRGLDNLATSLPAEILSTELPVVFDLLLKPMRKQASFFRRIRRPVFYIEDGCQDKLPASPWKGKFSAFYRRIPHARIIHTGYSVSDYFQHQGIHSVCVPKGYDHQHISNRHRDRDIPLGFIGRVKSDVYEGRRATLTALQQKAGLQLLRTEYGEDYVATLNRIQTFVSADVGLGEYMAKNFEALGAGCLLLAWRQGQNEEEHLGLVDGVNCLLYNSVEEALQKIDWIHHNPAAAQLIARRGEDHAKTRLAFDHMARAIAEAVLSAPLLPLPPETLLSRLKGQLGI